MDPVTVQILRNKIASLVDEMHYHFYRSGYSTIIRESRDFSCVILDRNGRLIVAPPVFSDGKIVAFSGSIAHKADVGGAVPGSTSANATEIFHEGLLLPPVKIWEGGQRVPDIERIILANSRQPELMRGDIHAQIAVTQMGATRVAELCRRFV